jgi:D-amino peptidase
MKILVAADMEGITGVTNWNHVSSDHAEYARFRRLMTGDVNAAVRGVLDAAVGEQEVSIADGHGTGSNILIDELDVRARLNTGSPKPLAMLQGIETGVDGLIFIGYHARAGSLKAILDHTWSSRSVINLWLNNRLAGEIALNTALAGHYQVPLLMISGDQTACLEASTLVPGLETAVVKQAVGRMAAECLPPQATQDLIYQAARRAVKSLAAGGAPAPLKLELPVRVTVEFQNSEMADNAALMPGSDRIEGRKVEYIAADVPLAYRGFRTMVALSWI